jgi:hypothetical protein
MKNYHFLGLLLLIKRSVYSFSPSIQIGNLNHVNLNHVMRYRLYTTKLVDRDSPMFRSRRTIVRSSLISENEEVSSESVRPQRMKNVNQFHQFWSRRVLLVCSGLLVSLTLLYSIAMIDENKSVTSLQELPKKIEVAYQNTYDAIAPLGISDVISVIVGESTAAVVAATASSIILILIKVNQKLPEFSAKMKAQVVADGDFLVAKAAALSLLSSIGLSPALAKLFSSLFASLLYGIFRLDAQRRDNIVQEDQILGELLAEQQKALEYERMQSGLLQTLVISAEGPTDRIIADIRSLHPVESTTERRLDFVDLFSDVTKWLQYDVLLSHFGHTLTWNGQAFLPGQEAAIFGAITCASAQLYCDVLYALFNLGGDTKSEDVFNRHVAEWFSLYLSQTLYGAALFFTYDAVQIPAQWLLQAFISGGIENCIGAMDYSGCIDTFIELNPPDESPEEAFYTAIIPIIKAFKQFVSATLSGTLMNE